MPSLLGHQTAGGRAHGVRFRNAIVTGIGSKQILVQDPAGNLVELFEPIRAEARLST